MAFSPIDIPIQEILETDFIVDIRTINNSNFLLIKDRVEDLINNLEIDVNTLSIGTDSPISYIKADSVIMDDTGFILQTGTPSVIISSLTKNGSDQSVLNVDILQVDVSIDADSLNINSALVIDDLTVDGNTTFNQSLTTTAAVMESKESISSTLSDNAGVAETTITLTSDTKQNIFLTLEADVSVYTFGALVAGLTSLNVIIDFDVANPPAQNAEFTIYIDNVVEQGTGLTIIADVNAYGGTGLNLTINAGVNQSTGNPIILHSDLVAAGLALGIQMTELKELNSLSSMLYIVDGTGTDRIMLKSLIEMDIF
jgi:hypothetical protein